MPTRHELGKDTCFRTLAFTPLICLLLGWPGRVFGQGYIISDLGSNAWSYSEAHGINGSGAVVGEYEPTTFFYVLAFLYTNGTMTDLGHLSGQPYAIAYGINNTNGIVGESDTSNATYAFLYVNGKMTSLGTLGGVVGGYSSAHAINEFGHIVGEATLANGSTIHAFLDVTGTKTDLGALGGNYSSASAINSSDVIVGDSDVVQGGVTNDNAFVYRNGVMSNLGTLGGSYSSAKGINDAGVIVGEAEGVLGGNTYLRAFVYRNGVMSDLGTLGGTTGSASAINNNGQIVGYATDSNEVANAFLYNGSTMINLSDLIPPGSGWTNLASADAINDAGQIAGSGYLSDGSYHAYLLTPAAALTVSITNPAPNATFQAPASFQVSASASDTSGLVTNVEFLVNNAVIGNASSAPYSATVNNLSAGAYTLTAIASDDGGAQATNSINVTVTDAAPTVTITNPAANATFQTPATFVVSASASDPDGTVTNVEFLANGAVMGNAVSAPYSATATGLSAGAYTLAAVASDNAGLKATNWITVTVTDVPPSVAITNPAPNATFLAPATIQVGASASDADGQVTNVEFLVNSAVIGNATAAPYGAMANNLSAGTYTLTAIASDNAGLTATNAISITVTNGALLPIKLFSPALIGGNFSFAFATQSGYTYDCQYVAPLALSNNWATFTNFIGDGSVAQVTNSNLTDEQRYYRVLAH